MINKHIFLITLLRGFFTLIVIAALLFISAGTLDFFAAWIFLAILGIEALLFSIWLYIAFPKQFINRLNPNELDSRQGKIVFLIFLTLCTSLVVSGLDKRFSWSEITDWRYLLAGILLCISASIYINVFANNPFLSNTVKIHAKHTVVKSGMYRIVRHPMYLASCIACASGIIVLGSWFCVPLYGIFIILILARIEIEERLLLSSLPEYSEYMSEVRHKILPFFTFKQKTRSR